MIEICDEQMIGTVDNLRTAAELGMLATLFKPVVAMGIQSALADVGGAGQPPSVAGNCFLVRPIAAHATVVRC